MDDAKPTEPETYLCDCGRPIYGETMAHLLSGVVAHLRGVCPNGRKQEWPTSADAMTLGELEALASRYGQAVKVIKEAQALFAAPGAAPAHNTPTTPPGPLQPPNNRPPTRFNDPNAEAELRAAQARRDAMRQPSGEVFPANIAAAMGES